VENLPPVNSENYQLDLNNDFEKMKLRTALQLDISKTYLII
jgi:hypothetical protein